MRRNKHDLHRYLYYIWQPCESDRPYLEASQ